MSECKMLCGVQWEKPSIWRQKVRTQVQFWAEKKIVWKSSTNMQMARTNCERHHTYTSLIVISIERVLLCIRTFVLFEQIKRLRHIGHSNNCIWKMENRSNIYLAVTLQHYNSIYRCSNFSVPLAMDGAFNYSHWIQLPIREFNIPSESSNTGKLMPFLTLFLFEFLGNECKMCVMLSICSFSAPFEISNIQFFVGCCSFHSTRLPVWLRSRAHAW